MGACLPLQDPHNVDVDQKIVASLFAPMKFVRGGNSQIKRTGVLASPFRV